MLRSGAPRAVFRSLQRANAHPARPAFNAATHQVQLTSTLSTLAARRPRLASAATLRSATTALIRHQTGGNTKPPQFDKIDYEAEKKLAQQKLQPTPETVSSTSSIHPVLGEVGVDAPKHDADMMAGIRHDVSVIKDTFSLSAVPRQAYVLGLAGVVPYLATSLSTVFCAWEINHSASGLTGTLMTGESAAALLEFLQPLQIGYGAVILSFLGAIHWGLEWAGFDGYHGYKRYAIGVAAPAIAWPTLLLPHTAALTTQFLAFVWLYYVDARATTRGWTPPWYGTYRFVLTFIVGASIVVSLIGRGEIAYEVKKVPTATERLLSFQNRSSDELAKEEEARVKSEGLKEEKKGGAKEESSEESSGDKEEKDDDEKKEEKKD